MSTKEVGLFREEEFEDVKVSPEKVVCLGMEFESDEARREWFRAELRKKLPELRGIEGFPIGEDDDIVNLSDPPYYTACPNPWLNDFIKEWEEEKVKLEAEGKRSAEFEVYEPYASDVSEGKNNPIYNAHSYHTKVPHPAIMRYILHYTQPGDIVYDGFAGTGMTGVAASICGYPSMELKKQIDIDFKKMYDKIPIWGKRKAICGDLSPIASFIASNYNTPVDPLVFSLKANKILNEVEVEYGWMYETKHKDGSVGIINYVVWSDVFICPNCSKEIIFVKEAIDMETKEVKEKFSCPHCNAIHTKKMLERAKENIYDESLDKIISQSKIVPVFIKYTTIKGQKCEKFLDADDYKILEKIKKTTIKNFIPTQRLPQGDECRRNDPQGITHVHHFFSKRNLIIASAIYDKTKAEGVLNSMMTSYLINIGSRMTRYKMGKSGNVNLPGTLYISSATAEQNLFAGYRGKIKDFAKAYSVLNKNLIQIVSATNSTLPSNSIDYIFTDPPFGANIMYSELNFLIESWFNVLTNNNEEAIINRVQEKSLFDYQDLMQKSFYEYYRVLKPGKWITIEFSNTSASVWNSIQHSLQSVGFVVANVAALDKKQGSFKAVTTTTAVKQDLVITCYKPTDELVDRFEKAEDKARNAMDFVEELLYHLPVHMERENSTTAVIERSPKILYDRLISYYVQHGYAIPMDAQEFQKALRERFMERDGMFFTASQVVAYEEKKAKTEGMVPMALLISSEAEGIEWLKRELEAPKTYQEIQPNWMANLVTPKKGDVLPELKTILEENFIEEVDGKWRKPDAEKAADLEALRGKKLWKEFNIYLEQAQKSKAKRMKEVRLEVLRYGFKECYREKNYKAIVVVGDHIQESLLQEDEVLLQYYDVASMRV